MPVTGDTHDLQFHKSLAQKWFMGVYKRTSAPLLDAQKSFSNDSQGMYMVGPDGTSYGYTNDHDPSNIHAEMDKALKKYQANPPKKVYVSGAAMKSQFAITPLATTSVIRAFSRIVPVPQGCTMLNKSVGRDFLWIYADDVRNILARAPHTGAKFKLPPSVAVRIARFHLMDGVRGTPDMWKANEVQKADFSAECVKSEGDLKYFQLRGDFSMRTASGRRGHQGNIEGEFLLDSRQSTVTRFRAISEGKAWGDGTYTPNAPKGKYNLKIAFVEAKDEISRIVPPEAVATENTDRIYHRP